MKVTVKSICERFGLATHQVKQIGSKQLFIVDTYHNGRLLVSYYTVVGYFNDKWYLTKHKYSCTTSQQLSQFANSTKFQVEWLDKPITSMVV